MTDVKKAYESARTSALTNNEALKAQTLSAKARAVALKALSIAGNMILMWGITTAFKLLSQALDSAADSLEDVENRITQNKSLFGDYTSKMDALIEKLEELKSVNSSLYSDAGKKELKEQIAYTEAQIALYQQLADVKREAVNADYIKAVSGNNEEVAIKKYTGYIKSGDWEGLGASLHEMRGIEDAIISPIQIVKLFSKVDDGNYISDTEKLLDEYYGIQNRISALRKYAIYNGSSESIEKSLDNLDSRLVQTKAEIAENIERINTASKNAIEYAVSTKRAAGSVSNFEQQQIKANASIQKSRKYFDLSTVSANAYKLAVKGITIIANMATSALLSGVVYAFSKLFTAQSEAIDKAKEFTSTYKSNNSSLEDYKEQINTLVTELNSSNLFYEDSKTKRKELISIQDELFIKYGTEEVIKSITAAINGAVDALDTLSQKSYYEWLASVDSLTGAQKFGNGFFKIFTGISDQYKSALDSAVGYMEDKTQFFYVKTTGNEELDNIIQKKFGLYKNVFDEFVIKDMVPEEAYELLGEIRTAYRDNATNYLGTETDNILTNVNNSIQSAMTTIDAELIKHQETYHTYLEGMIKYDSEYTDEYADLLSKHALLEEAELSPDDESKQQRILDTKKAFYDSLNNAIVSAENNDNVKRYFENLYPDLYSEISSWNFEYNISANTDGIADLAKEISEKYTATNLLGMIEMNLLLLQIMLLIH